MASEWKSVCLGDVVSINPDSLGRKWKQSTIRYIDISSVGEGLINAPPQQMPLSEAPSRAKRLLKQGDTVLSTVRPNRRSMFYAVDPGEDWVVSTGFAVIRPDRELIEPRYLYACIFNHDFTDYLITLEKGAAYPAVSPSDIATARLQLPPLKAQKAIAHILGSLDDKIELNRKMNETLEAMAQALFKSWFVDFDPVIDNALAAGNPIPPALQAKAECRRLNAEIHPSEFITQHSPSAHFPDAFQPSEEMGWIPKGWEECTLASLATPKKGKNITKKTIVDGNVPVVAGGLQPAYFHNTPNVYGPVITVSASGANAGFVNLYHQDIWASDCSYISASETDFIYSVFLFMKSRQEQITHMQQGAAQPHVYPKDLLRLRYANPPRDRWIDIEKIVEPLFHKIRENEKENKTLTKLRDTLLPKLISGELRIEEAEKMVEEAE